MRYYCYKITELKAKSGLVLDLLNLPSSDCNVRGATWARIVKLLNTLRDDLYVVVETDYVDVIYRDLNIKDHECG